MSPNICFFLHPCQFIQGGIQGILAGGAKHLRQNGGTNGMPYALSGIFREMLGDSILVEFVSIFGDEYGLIMDIWKFEISYLADLQDKFGELRHHFNLFDAIDLIRLVFG